MKMYQIKDTKTGLLIYETINPLKAIKKIQSIKTEKIILCRKCETETEKVGVSWKCPECGYTEEITGITMADAFTGNRIIQRKREG